MHRTRPHFLTFGYYYLTTFCFLFRQAALGDVQKAAGDVKGGYVKPVECSENMCIANVHRSPNQKEHSHGVNHAP